MTPCPYCRAVFTALPRSRQIAVAREVIERSLRLLLRVGFRSGDLCASVAMIAVDVEPLQRGHQRRDEFVRGSKR